LAVEAASDGKGHGRIVYRSRPRKRRTTLAAPIGCSMTPLAESITIIMEVPERGSPESIVIDVALPGLSLVLGAYRLV
jgi:hypothetical protein